MVYGIKEITEEFNDKCSICYCYTKFIIYELPYKHDTFCEYCIETWLERKITCPICRTKFR